MSEVASRSDPYSAFNFLIEIDEINVGGFSEVSGLSIETEVDQIREGGVNDYVHHLSKGTKYSDITLKRGLMDSYALSDWYEGVVEGNITKKNLTIHLRNNSDKNVRSWVVSNAYPKKWEGPTLNAGSNAYATENLVLVHEGLKIQKK